MLSRHRPSGGLHGFLGLSLLVAFSACEPAETSVCVSSADCARSYSCVDGECLVSGGATDGLDDFDAGSPYRVDAGSPYADAGRPAEVDAGGTVDAGGVCGAAACVAQGAECGDIVDACSTIVSCGDCGIGHVCGERETPFANQCRCQPLSCTDLGAQCGPTTDNCGVEQDCGGCDNNERCSDNQCECVPRECSDVGAECGQIDTGCGWMRDCGGCTAPERCGGTGVAANTCGCTTRQRATNYVLLRTARNVNVANGSTNWSDLGNGVQVNRSGADFDVSGYCGYEGGGGDGCGCCARAEARDTTTNFLQLTGGGLQR